MNNQIDEAVNERYRKIAEGKEPPVTQQDLMWVTPGRLGALFGVLLIMTVLVHGF